MKRLRAINLGDRMRCLCGCREKVKDGNKYVLGHNSKRKNSPKYIPRETRYCACGCGQSFECRINSKRKYILGHNSCKSAPWGKKVSQLCACGCGGKTNPGRRYINKHAIRVFNVNPWIPYETRICICGCNKSYKCKINSKQRYIRGHNTKGEWQNLAVRRRRLVNVYGANQRTPNGPESLLIWMISELRLPIKYVGDGSCWIGRLNPDFIFTDGRKKIIEHYGDYWHANPFLCKEKERRGARFAEDIWAEDKLREEKFRSYGYEVLVIWERELYEETCNVKERLKDFAANRCG